MAGPGRGPRPRPTNPWSPRPQPGAPRPSQAVRGSDTLHRAAPGNPAWRRRTDRVPGAEPERAGSWVSVTRRTGRLPGTLLTEVPESALEGVRAG